MQFFDQHILLALIALPMLGAAVIMFIPGGAIPGARAGARDKSVRRVATAFGIVVMLLSFYVFARYYFDGDGARFANSWRWLELPGPWKFGDIGISLTLGVDGVAAPMLLLTGIVMFTGTLVSWSIKDWNKDFFILYFLLLAGVFGVFASYDLFFFFFFYELSVLPMYLLIGVWGSSSRFPKFSRTKEYSAMKLTLYLVAGSVLIWVALMAIFVEAGLGTFDIKRLAVVEYSPTFQKVFFPFLAIGFGILAGLWPFHTWSPDGHVAAPTAVSMVHAGVLMKLGAFGIIRVGMVILPEGAEFWMPALLGLGTVNVIYGAISAMGQSDLKYVIGYSSVSHMGYVVMGIATLHPLGLSGAVLQMFSHGIMTALFFAVVGVVYDRTHTRDMLVLDGLGKAHARNGSILHHRRPDIARLARTQRLRRRVASLPRPIQDIPHTRHARHHRRGNNRRVHPAPARQGVLRPAQPAAGRISGACRQKRRYGSSAIGRQHSSGSTSSSRRQRASSRADGRDGAGEGIGCHPDGVHPAGGVVPVPVHARHKRRRGGSAGAVWVRCDAKNKPNPFPCARLMLTAISSGGVLCKTLMTCPSR